MERYAGWMYAMQKVYYKLFWTNVKFEHIYKVFLFASAKPLHFQSMSEILYANSGGRLSDYNIEKIVTNRNRC